MCARELAERLDVVVFPLYRARKLSPLGLVRALRSIDPPSGSGREERCPERYLLIWINARGLRQVLRH